MYILSAPTTRSSAPQLTSNLQSNSMRSLSQTQTNPLSRNKDTANMSDKIYSKNFKMLSKMKLPQQQQQQQQIVSLRQGSNSNNNKLRDVISQQQAVAANESVVSASNAVAAELKGAPMLSIHDNDNSSISVDGQFNHNTLEEFYKEPMYFGTENSTTVTTQIGATAHLPCTIHHIGEGVVSIHTNTYLNKYSLLHYLVDWICCSTHRATVDSALLRTSYSALAKNQIYMEIYAYR